MATNDTMNSIRFETSIQSIFSEIMHSFFLLFYPIIPTELLHHQIDQRNNNQPTLHHTIFLSTISLLTNQPPVYYYHTHPSSAVFLPIIGILMNAYFLRTAEIAVSTASVSAAVATVASSFSTISKVNSLAAVQVKW